MMAYFQLSKTSVRLAHPLVFTLSAAGEENTAGQQSETTVSETIHDIYDIITKLLIKSQGHWTNFDLFKYLRAHGVLLQYKYKFSIQFNDGENQSINSKMYSIIESIQRVQVFF